MARAPMRDVSTELSCSSSCHNALQSTHWMKPEVTSGNAPASSTGRRALSDQTQAGLQGNGSTFHSCSMFCSNAEEAL